MESNLKEKILGNKALLYSTLLLPAFLLYFKSLFFQFTSLDEQWMIVSNSEFLKSSESLKQAFTTPLAGLYYRPFLLLTILFDFKIGGLEPFFFHFSNLIFHLLSILILYKTLLTFKTEKITALLLTVLFSIHPIHLHAVAWVPGRNDTLLFIFSMSSLLFLKNFLDHRKPLYLILHFISFLLALSTKETAMLLPILYFLVYFLYSTEFKFSIKLSFLWILMSSAWYLLRWKIVDHPLSTGENIFQSIFLTLQGLSLYLGKIFFASPLSVFPSIKNSSLIPGTIAVLLITVLFLFPGVKNKKNAFLGLFIFILLMSLPVWFSAVHTSKEQYEHRAYLPMAGLLLFVAQLNINFNSKLSTFIFSSLILICFIISFIRMEVYRNKKNFIETAVKESPDHYFFQMQMGEMLAAQGNYEKAIEYYSKALEIRSNKYEIYNNRGIALYNLGKYPKALFDFNTAIQRSDFNPAYYLNRCNTYVALNNNNEALNDLLVLLDCCADAVPQDLTKNVIDTWLEKEGVKLDSVQNKIAENASQYFKRGQLLIGIGNSKKGLQDLKTAAELAPDSVWYLKYFLKKQTEFAF